MKNQPISVEVQQLMAATRVQVASRLNRLFQAQAVIAAIGGDLALRLARMTAEAQVPLLRVASEVRDGLSDQCRGSKLGTSAVWHVVDAIGHLSDCDPGRWAYFTDANRRQSIQWALQELDQLETMAATAQECAEQVEA